MNADIFQAALSATARIACCAVLVSCQKTPENPTPPMQEHADQQAEKPSENQQTAPKEMAEKDKADTKKSEIVEAPAPMNTECDPMIEQYFQARQKDPSVEVSKELEKCCVDLLSDIKKKIEAQPRGEFEPLPNILHDDCCMITDYRRPGCTPWGPPMPPTLV